MNTNVSHLDFVLLCRWGLAPKSTHAITVQPETPERGEEISPLSNVLSLAQQEKFGWLIACQITF